MSVVISFDEVVAFRKAGWKRKRKQSICCLCTWWQPWFPQTQRAWTALQGGGVWQQSGFPCLRWCASCCSEPIGKLQWQLSRRYHWQTSSWCSWPWMRYQCRGGPASEPCRYKWNSFPCETFCGSSSLQRACFWQQPSSLPSWMQLCQACWVEVFDWVNQKNRMKVPCTDCFYLSQNGSESNGSLFKCFWRGLWPSTAVGYISIISLVNLYLISILERGA